MMMNKKEILIISILFTLILSCTKELKESERNWNPYVITQVIIFESSEKELDTITITEINDNVISTGPTLKLYDFKSLRVYGKKVSLQESKFAENKILDIEASTPDKPSQIGFPLYFENAKFAGWGFKLEDLEKYPTMSMTTKAGTFDDVIKLEPVVRHPERENEVQFMYWSKENGYIKFERADGFTWELIKKYVP